MRFALRVLAGFALVTAGNLSLACGAVAWALGPHRTAVLGGEGAFVATLAPVRTDGYAIVVPDVADVLARHGVARHLGDGRLTVIVRSASAGAEPLSVALVPAADAGHHLTTVARTEVVAVGYATGVQPVQAVVRPGGGPPGRAPWDTAVPVASAPATAATAMGVALSGRLVTVTLDVPTDEPVALVIRRWDNARGLTATITVRFAPDSWGTATVVLLMTGAFGSLAGLGLLVSRPPWIGPSHPLLAGLDGAPEHVRVEPPPPPRRSPPRRSPPRQEPPRRSPPPGSRRRRPGRIDVSPGYAPTRHARPVDSESPYVHTAT